MALNWNWCPLCREALETRMFEDRGLRACTKCNFVDWDNPIPVVASLIPKDGGIVLVQRGVSPFKGEWCLPCGYVSGGENPKFAARRENSEECGLLTRMVGLINACTPQVPGIRLNQLLILYLAREIGGMLAHGSDALAARVFQQHELPPICFGSHQIAIDDWFAGNLGTLSRPRQVIDRKLLPALNARRARDRARRQKQRANS
jgi:ADP-ribose pyrophosphatase YjhB (NUDIX family)